MEPPTFIVRLRKLSGEIAMRCPVTKKSFVEETASHLLPSLFIRLSYSIELI